MKLLLLLKIVLSAVVTISCEESHSVETVGRPQLQYGNGTHFRDHGQETEKRITEISIGTDVNGTGNWMTGVYNGTDVNDTGNWMTGVYNETDVNQTGTWRMGVSEGSNGIHQRNLMVEDTSARHHGNSRNRNWGWGNCTTTCSNSTGRTICTRTCPNRRCVWRPGCFNTWNGRTGDCSRIFRIMMYYTSDQRPGNSNAAYVNHTRAKREEVSSETNQETYRRHIVSKY